MLRMAEVIPLARPLPAPAHVALRRRATAVAVYAVAAANAGVIVWLWIHGGNLEVTSAGEALTSIGRITGLLSAYLALLQVILLARLPALERAVGFDRLSVWHRWNGHACIDLVVAHVVFTVWGYALMDKFTVGKEISTMLGGGIYAGMITATIGTAMLIGVVATSLVIVRRRLSYEWWYAVHLLAYAGIALSWFHEIPTGNELVLDHTAADYWRALYLVTIAILVVFRLVLPLLQVARHRLTVAEVIDEGPGVVSLRLVGRRLDRLQAEPGQFFLWRFLDRRRIWSAHPFSLSAAPDGGSLRITVKALGDHTARIAGVRGAADLRIQRTTSPKKMPAILRLPERRILYGLPASRGSPLRTPNCNGSCSDTSATHAPASSTNTVVSWPSRTPFTARADKPSSNLRRKSQRAGSASSAARATLPSL